MPSNSRPRDKSPKKTKRNKRNRPASPHYKTESHLSQHARDGDCKPRQCLGRKVKYTACSFYAENARGHTMLISQRSCNARVAHTRNYIYPLGWIKSLCMLPRQSTSSCKPCMFPIGTVRGRTEGRPTERPAGELGDACEAPRRPTDEGTHHSKDKTPLKKTNNRQKTAKRKNAKTTQKHT